MLFMHIRSPTTTTLLEFEANARETSGRTETICKVQHVPASGTASNASPCHWKLSPALVIYYLYFSVFLSAAANSQTMTKHSTQHTQPLQHILLKNLLPFQVEQSNILVPKLLAFKHQSAEVTYFKIFCPVEESPSEKKAVIQTLQAITRNAAQILSEILITGTILKWL